MRGRAADALVFGVIAGVLVVGATVWALSFGSLTQVSSLPALNPTEPASGWLMRIVALPGFFVGTFGTRGLGWLDTVMPPIVWIPAAAAYVLALAWGLRRRDWRKVVALLVTLGGSAVVVDAIATLRHSMPERVLQPRYFLPLLILAAMVALARGNEDGPQLHLGSRVLLVLGLGVAQAAALHTNLRRYLTGLDVHGWNLNDGIEWWWSWAPPPMVVLGVGSVAFLGALLVVGMASRRHSEPSMATLSE